MSDITDMMEQFNENLSNCLKITTRQYINSRTNVASVYVIFHFANGDKTQSLPVSAELLKSIDQYLKNGR